MTKKNQERKVVKPIIRMLGDDGGVHLMILIGNYEVCFWKSFLSAIAVWNPFPNCGVEVAKMARLELGLRNFRVRVVEIERKTKKEPK